MNAVETKEFDIMQITIAVMPELGEGHGRISAKNRVNDTEALERARVYRGYMEMVRFGAPVGCIDGRPVLHTIEGNESMLGPKTAGGAAITGLLALELEDAFGDDGNIYQHLVRTINMLESGDDESKVPVRFHANKYHAQEAFDAITFFREELNDVRDINEFIDKVMAAGIEAKNTGCGMDDQFYDVVTTLADLPRTYRKRDNSMHTETKEEAAARIRFIKDTTAAIEGSDFSEERFERHVDNATRLVEGPLKDWKSIIALIIADRALSDLGVENGIMSRLEVLEAAPDGEGVHGHIEDDIIINKRKGYTFNQTQYCVETSNQAFTFDHWIGVKIADQTAATLTGIKERHAGIVQGVTTANVGAAFQLTDGSQRPVIFS